MTLHLIPIVLVSPNRKNKKYLNDRRVVIFIVLIISLNCRRTKNKYHFQTSNWTFFSLLTQHNAVVCFEWIYLLLLWSSSLSLLSRWKSLTDMVCRHTILVYHLPYKGVFIRFRLLNIEHWKLMNDFIVLELRNSSTNSVVKYYNAYDNFASSFPFLCPLIFLLSVHLIWKKSSVAFYAFQEYNDLEWTKWNIWILCQFYKQYRIWCFSISCHIRFDYIFAFFVIHYIHILVLQFSTRNTSWSMLSLHIQYCINSI